MLVAVVPEPPGGTTDPAVRDAVRRAADALVEAGYEIVEACPPRYEEAVGLWRQFVLGDFAAVLELMLPMIGRDGQTFLTTVNSTASPPDYKAMSQIFISRHGIAREWSEFFARYPLMLTPTWTKLPFEHGFDVATPEGTAATMELLRPTLPANLLGLPSACVCAGADEATGLPIGVLLTGPRFREDLCLDAAEIIEKRYPAETPINPMD
jgi:amidase